MTLLQDDSLRKYRPAPGHPHPPTMTLTLHIIMHFRTLVHPLGQGVIFSINLPRFRYTNRRSSRLIYLLFILHLHATHLPTIFNGMGAPLINPCQRISTLHPPLIYLLFILHLHATHLTTIFNGMGAQLINPCQRISTLHSPLIWTCPSPRGLPHPPIPMVTQNGWIQHL